MATRASKAPSSSPPRKKAPRVSRPAPRLFAPTAAELPATRAMLGAVRTELLERIDQARHELKGEIQEVKAGLHRVEAGLHGVQADMARIVLLFEEQNARNKVVLDGLAAFMDRQTRVEQRMDAVEDTVRGLAAARAAG